MCRVYHVGMPLPPGQAPLPLAEVTPLAEARLHQRHKWSEAQVRGAASAAATLVRDVANRPFCIAGLSGAPGSGKSALAKLVVEVLEQSGVPALALSLDDYYLGRSQRRQLAHRHPLFAQRGVPGTHDWSTLVGDLDALREGRLEALQRPRFDKASDERIEQSRFPPVKIQPRLVILEGWLIGAPPLRRDQLLEPLNELEAADDEDGRWRTQVSEGLARYHEDLSARIDRRWFLAVPGWASTIEWRWQQERELADGGCHLESREAVVHFLDQFQRIAMHMLDTCDDWADIVIRIDKQHVMHID